MLAIDSNVRIATVNGRQVEIEGPQAHPFRCTECSSCYREHRHAARCCRKSSEDLRSGEVRDFCPVYEAMRVQEDEVRWKAIMDEYHFECSCGESFKTVDAAINCRKCRTYTEEGYCTEVIDRNDDQVVWSIKTELEALIAEVTSDTPLTHNPFASLLD